MVVCFRLPSWPVERNVFGQGDHLGIYRGCQGGDRGGLEQSGSGTRKGKMQVPGELF